MKVILVDDEKAMLLVMKKKLRKLHGVEIVGAFQNSQEALLFLNENTVDIVFLDISMPGESGLELARRLSTTHPEVGLVFITAHKDFALDAFKVYAFDYIVKPVSQVRLEHTINRWRSKRNVSAPEKEDNRDIFIQCFGQANMLFRDGRRVRWISAKSMELFYYLLTERGRWVPRDKLIEEVFNETPMKNAAGYLNTAIYQLRKVLERYDLKKIVESGGDKYRIDIKNLYIDFISFENRINKLNTIDRSNYLEALAVERLYIGNLFEDKSFMWAISEQERLRNLYSIFAKKLGRFLIDYQNLTDSYPVLTKILNMDELDEEANHMLLELFAAQKDRVSLTKHFDKYAKKLEQELGVKPGRGIATRYQSFIKDLGD